MTQTVEDGLRSLALVGAATLSVDTIPRVIPFDEMSSICKDFNTPELCSHRPVIVITALMRSILKKLTGHGFFITFLQGSSGVGKTTTLTTVGHFARKAGYLVFPIQGHRFAESLSAEDLHIRVVSLLARWRKENEPILARNFCALDVCKSRPNPRSLLNLVDEALHTTEIVSYLIEILENLKMSFDVPVLFLIDQFNSFHEALAKLSSSLRNDDVTRFFRFFTCLESWGDSDRGAALFAFSSSFSIIPHAKDGMSRQQIFVAPMEIAQFKIFLRETCGRLQLTDVQCAKLFEICGGLPREAVAFCQCLLDAGKDNFAAAEQAYFASRIPFYDLKIGNMLMKLGSDGADEFKNDSIIFAARTFVGSRMNKVPNIWINVGLVVEENGTYRLSCSAALKALYSAFPRCGIAKLAIDVYSADPAVRWRALELGVVYLFRNAIAAGSPVTFKCTDLLGKYPHDIKVLVQNITYSAILPAGQTIRPGTLYVCPMNTEAIDFFVYGTDGLKLGIQVSESSYAKHKAKYADAQPIIAALANSTSPLAAPSGRPASAKSAKEPSYQYIYITTSKAKMQIWISYLRREVHLVSNINDNGGTKEFFNGLIAW